MSLGHARTSAECATQSGRSKELRLRCGGVGRFELDCYVEDGADGESVVADGCAIGEELAQVLSMSVCLCVVTRQTLESKEKLSERSTKRRKCTASAERGTTCVVVGTCRRDDGQAVAGAGEERCMSLVDVRPCGTRIAGSIQDVLCHRTSLTPALVHNGKIDRHIMSSFVHAVGFYLLPSLSSFITFLGPIRSCAPQGSQQFLLLLLQNLFRNLQC